MRRAPRPPVRTSLPALLALLALAAGACGPGGAGPAGDEAAAEHDPGDAPALPAPTPPPVPGAVLSIAGVPILRDTLDALTAAARITSPSYSTRSLQRTVLEGILVPQAAVHAAWLEEREAAHDRAVAALARLEAGQDPGEGLTVRDVEVDFRQLGLPLWAAARESPRGAWIGPVEDVGRFFLARRLGSKPSPGGQAGLVILTLQIVELPFLPGAEPEPWIEEALSKATLAVHDAAVGALLPQRLLWRMKRE